MRTIIQKISLAVFCLVAMGFSTSATTFTVIASGDFNSAATWLGGLIPGSLISTDEVYIPAGFTVTLNTDEVFSSTSSLVIDGTLTSGGLSTALTLTSGTLSGSGNISVDTMNLGLTSGLTFTGSIMAGYLNSTGANIASDANITVSNTLMLSAGALNLTSGTLTMGNNSNIDVMGGSVSASGTGLLDLDSSYNVTYTTSSTIAGGELSGSGLHNVTLNLSGNVTLSSNLSVNGTLALTSGTLSLNGHDLTINAGGNVTTGSGNISGSSSSSIMVMSSGSLSGSLMFASGGNTLQDLTINTGSGSSVVSITGPLTINGALTLQTGTLSGSGGITADSLDLGSTANINASGNIMTNYLTSTGATISSAANVKVSNGLMLNSGSLNFSAGSLTMGNNSNIDITGGTLSTSGSGTLDLDSVYNVTYTGSSITAGAELSGSGLHNVSVGVSGTVTLSGNLGINGTLALNSGTLSLNGHTLAINAGGNVTTGTGNISGSATSNIMIMSTGSLSGTLNFASGGNTLHDLIINTGSGSDAVSLGGSGLTLTGGLNLQAGTLSGSGDINTDSLDLGPTASLTFSGNILAANLKSMGTTISSGSTNLTVSSMLMLNSGALNFTAGSLTLGNNSNVDLSGGTLTSSGAATLNLDSAYNVIYTTASATAGIELTGTGLHNITVNVPGTVILGGNLTVNGTLSLMAGTLTLNGHDLTINTNGGLAAGGSGSINSSSTSDISIMSLSSLAGSLNFATGGDTVNDLTLNLGGSGSNVNLGSSLNVNGTLNLQHGNIMLGANNLMVNAAGSVTGGSAGSYVVTNGGGQLMMNVMAGSTDTFKVGTAAYFSPMAIQGNTGSTSGSVGVNVVNNVFADGYGGSSLTSSDALVNATWFLTAPDSVGMNINMYAMWSSAMEVNGFDRTHSFISHYTGGAWDTTNATAAVSAAGGLYMMSRTGVTSFSPFMVADRSFEHPTSVPMVASGSEIVLFPNPATTDLHFTASSPINTANIYSITGQLVCTCNVANNAISIQTLPSGVYTIQLIGDNFTDNKKFIKE